MSEQAKDPISDPEELKTSDEETESQSSSFDDVLSQDSTQGSETTCSKYPAVRASTPKSVQSNETTDRDRLTLSEWESDEFFTASEWQEQKRKAGKKKSGLSARMEYLARPKKDFLDRVGFERFDGVLPEKSLPSWPILPLPTKLPVARYPYEITMTKLGENVYLPPPGERMDLRDENNLRPPMKIYHSLHDPHLKAHFNKEEIRKHLKKESFVSKSGRVVCSLEDINEYREYTRRVLAERIQQIYRDQQEEKKKENERRMKEKFDEEEEKLRNARAQTNLRSYIKNAVSSIQEGSMECQRERDRKVLNKQIRLQVKWKQNARAKQQRYEQVFHQHMSEKYEREEKKRLMELEQARLDVEHIEKLCRKREKERLDRRQKLEDFWLRKAEEQIAWVEEGLELEKKWFEDREAKIAWRKTRAVAPHIKRKTPKGKTGKSEKIDDRTIDEILKQEEETASTMDEILRELSTVVLMEENPEEEQVKDLKDKSATVNPESFVKNDDRKIGEISKEEVASMLDEMLSESNGVVQKEEKLEEEQVEDSEDKSIRNDLESSVDNGTKKSSSAQFTISVEQDQKTVTEDTQPEQNISIEENSPKKQKSSDKLKEKEDKNGLEQDKNVLEETKGLYKDKDLSEKGKLDRKLSLSSSAIKKSRPKGKESEQKSSPVESSSDKNTKEKGTEENPSQEIERKLSLSSSAIKKPGPKGKESEQKSSPVESSSDQNTKEKNNEENPSEEIERKLSLSSSAIKKPRPKEKESEQEPSPDKTSSEQKPKEESNEKEQPSLEVEDLKDKAVMAEPESFILSDTEESNTDETKQKDQISENKNPK